MSFTSIRNGSELPDGYTVVGETSDGYYKAYLVDHPKRGRGLLYVVSESWRSRLRRFGSSKGEQPPNLMHFYGELFYQGCYYVVTEYVAPRPLRENLEVLLTGRVDVVAFMMKIALAVDALHDLGLPHGAISTATIHLTDSLDVKLELPFQSHHLEDSLTVAQAKAPELWSGDEPSVVTDIYSLGVVFYELLTHEVPFRASDLAALKQMHQTHNPTPPGALVLCHPDLQRLVGRMLFKEPLGRLQSVALVLEALVRIPASTTHPTIQHSKVVETSSDRFPYRSMAICSALFVFAICLCVGTLKQIKRGESVELANFLELAIPRSYRAKSLRFISGAPKADIVQIRFQGLGSGQLHEYRSTTVGSERLVKIWNTRPTKAGDSVVYSPLRHVSYSAGLPCHDTGDCWMYKHSDFEWLYLVDLRVNRDESFPLYTWISSSRKTPIQVLTQQDEKIAECHFNNFGRVWQIGPASMDRFEIWLGKWLLSVGVDESWSVEVGVVPESLLVVRHFYDCSSEENYFGNFSDRCNRFEDSIWGLNRRREPLGRIVLVSGRIKEGKLTAQEALWVVEPTSGEASAS